jgi:hypothetical protein
MRHMHDYGTTSEHRLDQGRRLHHAQYNPHAMLKEVHGRGRPQLADDQIRCTAWIAASSPMAAAP